VQTIRSSKVINRQGSRSFALRQRVGLFFVLPSVLFVSLFFLLPLGMTIWMSLHDWSLLGKRVFTGLDNYSSLLSDSTFWQSLGFTAQYTALVTPIIFILAFALALLVSLPLRFISVLRTIYFLPVVIGLGASSLLWVWLFNDQVGAFSAVLMQLKLVSEPVDWLGEPTRAQLAVILMVVWKTVGFTMMLFLVGLQSIPTELYEAARIDGAAAWAQMRFITLPLMRRTFALALVVSVIGSFLSFDQFYIMTRGGPQNSTITVVYWIYRSSFTYFKLGYGAALSVILLLILALISVIQLRLLRDETQY
jgi:multiple sugar transport system permease protein